MIGIEGQYVFKFQVGNSGGNITYLDDFISEANLLCFKLIEDVANVLPMFQLLFKIHDDALLKYLNEGNVLKITFGANKNEMYESRLRIVKVVSHRASANLVEVAITGLFDAVSYLTDPHISITDKVSSVDAIKILASKYFEIDSTGVSTSDSMRWAQHNIIDKFAVSNIWLHSYIPSSFMALGITSGGVMRLRDWKKLSSGEFKWRFTQDEKDPKNIDYENFSIDSNTGFANFMHGYGKRRLVNRLEEGDSVVLEDKPLDPILAVSPDRPVSSDIQKDYDEHVAVSFDNVHENYHKAWMQNLMNLTAASSMKIKIAWANRFKRINVLDLVYFKDHTPTTNKQSSEFYTGLWVVSKVGLVLEHRKFMTYVDIVREGFNSIKGDLG